MMDNYATSTKMATDAINSQGLAEAKNNIYLDSISAKLKVLGNEITAMWQKGINSSAIKGLIDGATSLVKVFGNLHTIISLVVTGLLVFKGASILNFFTSLPSKITNSVMSMSVFKTAIGAMQLADEGLIAKNEILKLSFIALGDSIKATFLANPLGWLAIAITTVISAIDIFNSKQAEAAQKAEEAQQKLEQESQGLQDLKSQYSQIISSGDLTTESKSQLKSIQDQLIKSYGLEADALDLVNGKYEDQIKLINEASAKKAQDLINSMGNKPNEAKANLSKQSYEIIASDAGKFFYNNEADAQIKELINKAFDEYTTRKGYIPGNTFEQYGTLGENITKLKELLTSLQNIPNPSKNLQGFITDLSNQLNKLNPELTENQDILSKYNDAQNTVDFYNQFKDQINQVNDLMIELNKTTDSDKKADITKQLQDIKTEMDNTTRDSSKIEQYKSAIDDLFSGLKEEADKATDSMDNFNTSVDQVDFNKLLTDNKDVVSGLKSLNQAIADVTEGQSLNAEEVANLVATYPSLANAISQTAGGYTIEKSALETLRQTQVDTLNTAIDSQTKDTQATFQEITKRIQMYQSEINALNTLKAQAIATMQSSTTAAEWQLNAWRVSAASESASNASSQLAGLQKQLDQLKAIQAQSSALKTVLSNPSYGVSGSSSASKTAEDAAKKAEEARNAMKQNVEDVEQAITDIIKKEFEKRKQAIEDEYDARKTALQKEKDLYDKQSEDDAYQKNLKKEQETLNGINSQIVNAQRDSSLAGQSRLRDLLEQAKEQQDKIDQMILDHTKQANDARFDQEIQNLDTQKQSALDALNNQFSDENISKMVNKALVTGQLDSLGSVLDAYKNFQNTYNDGLTASGQLLQTQFIDKWEQIQKLINGTSGISIGVDIKSLPVPQYANGGIVSHTGLAWVDGTTSIPELMVNGKQAVNILRNLAINPPKMPNINSKNISPAINFNEPMVVVQGNISSEIDLNKVIREATKEVTSNLKQVLVDSAVYNH